MLSSPLDKVAFLPIQFGFDATPRAEALFDE
jgi:hypothetical protein